MSWSQAQQSEDLHDQIIILVGSAIRLLCGEAGVFVISNEAFDPLSSVQHSVYRLSDGGCGGLLKYIRERRPPDKAHPFLVDCGPPALVVRVGKYRDLLGGEAGAGFECCFI